MDEQEVTATIEAPVAAEPTVATSDLPEHAREVFHVASNLQHDRVNYPAGSTIEGHKLTVEQFQQLRRDEVLKYKHEVAQAEDFATQVRAQEEALREAHAQIEQLRRQLTEAQKTGKK